jgi:CheY-like chemotaxis protein
VGTVAFPWVEAAEATEEEARAPSETARGGPESVLLVEDEDAVRQLSNAVLRVRGYQVLEARDGEEALALARRHLGPIDVVVTDIVMPRMGGRDLAQRLLSDRPAMKVLYVSGYSEAAIQSHGVLGNNSAFIAKPFTPHDLRRRFERSWTHGLRLAARPALNQLELGVAIVIPAHHPSRLRRALVEEPRCGTGDLGQPLRI